MKTKLAFFTISSIFFSSCSNNTIISSARFYGHANIKKNSIQRTANITLEIPKLIFKTKASSSAKLGKNISDIKSYKAFLTTNFSNPFIAGSNPKGDGVQITANVNPLENTIITFSSVPQGGPYYAVLAAFDASNNNITKLDQTIQSTEKNWARSKNNVTVLSDGSLKYSNSLNNLDIVLMLLEATPLSIGLNLTINPATQKKIPISGRGS